MGAIGTDGDFFLVPKAEFIRYEIWFAIVHHGLKEGRDQMEKVIASVQMTAEMGGALKKSVEATRIALEAHADMWIRLGDIEKRMEALEHG